MIHFVKLFIFGAIAYLAYRLLKGFFSADKKIRKGPDAGVIDEMVQDPYCKTYIPRRESKKKIIGGREFFFCSTECATKFEAERKEKS